MKEACQRLQELGAQKIHEDTHISRIHIQAVIHESFENLNRVQFLGFISILEREYDLDLSTLKAKGLLYFEQNTIVTPSQKGVFVLSQQEKKPTAIYIGLAVIIVLLLAFFSFNGSFTESQSILEPTENKIIVKAKESVEATPIADVNVSDVNMSVTDVNVTKSEELNSSELVVQEPEELQAFTIKAKKVWIGYINVSNHKKYQETFKGEITLKRDKEWLLILGHSHVKFHVNGELKTFNAKGNLYLHYKDGEIEKLTLSEFKKLNRGRKW